MINSLILNSVSALWLTAAIGRVRCPGRVDPLLDLAGSSAFDRVISRSGFPPDGSGRVRGNCGHAVEGNITLSSHSFALMSRGAGQAARGGSRLDGFAFEVVYQGASTLLGTAVPNGHGVAVRIGSRGAYSGIGSIYASLRASPRGGARPFWGEGGGLMRPTTVGVSVTQGGRGTRGDRRS